MITNKLECKICNQFYIYDPDVVNLQLCLDCNDYRNMIDWYHYLDWFPKGV